MTLWNWEIYIDKLSTMNHQLERLKQNLLGNQFKSTFKRIFMVKVVIVSGLMGDVMSKHSIVK
jgi:hypothetical protein